MVKFEDRKYQHDCINELYNSFYQKAKSLVVLPTSAGKTHIFCELIKKCVSVKSDIKILVLMNKVSLVAQNRKEAELRGIKSCSYYCSSLGERKISQVTFATIQSISSSIKQFGNENHYSKTTKNLNLMFHLILIDETHNITETFENFYDYCLEINPKLKLAGFTATPFRKEGFIYGKDKFYEDVTYSLPLNSLIESGYITDYILFDTKDKFDVSKLKKQGDDYNLKQLSKLVDNLPKAEKQVIDFRERVANRNKVAIMCVDISHCEKIKKLLEDYGEEVALTHSKLSKKEQEENIKYFEDGSAKFLVSVNQVTEGYSYTAIDTVILLRPTRSPRLMVQMIGRGLRNHDGKENCLVLDYGDVLMNCGTPRSPIIEEIKIRGYKKTILSEFRSCPACLMYNPRTNETCDNCGKELVKKRDPNKNLNEKPFQDIDRIDSDTVSVTFMEVDWKYVGKSGKPCYRIKYYTTRRQYFKWIFRQSEKDEFFTKSRFGVRKPKFIKVIKNSKNKTYPIITEIW
jgi:DNA repair protein RadD